MPTWVHEDFDRDENTYKNAQEFWVQLVRQALVGTGVCEKLEINYLNNPDRDGNPIFSAIHRQAEIAIRIIQHKVDATEDDYAEWTQQMQGEDVYELVIDCCPSLERLPMIREWIRLWFPISLE